MSGALVPIFDATQLAPPSTIVENFDVSGWRTIVWSITGAGNLAAQYLWLNERWSFPDDTDNGWPSDLAQPFVTHVIAGIPSPLLINYQLRAVRPKAPLLTLGLSDVAGIGQRVHARLWGSPYELTTAELWPGPFTLAEAVSVGAAGGANPTPNIVSLAVPAYVGPVIAHASSNATDAISRIDLRSGINNPGNRIDILWKPTSVQHSRPVMLPPGPNTIDLVNNDGVARSFDVALTPYGRG